MESHGGRRRLKEYILLKIADAKDIPQHMKITFRTHDVTYGDSKKLLMGIKVYNSWIKTDNCKILEEKAGQSNETESTPG
jgi:hypothetical protein